MKKFQSFYERIRFIKKSVVLTTILKSFGIRTLSYSFNRKNILALCGFFMRFYDFIRIFAVRKFFPFAYNIYEEEIMFEIRLTVKAENAGWIQDKEEYIKSFVERAGGFFDCCNAFGSREMTLSCDNRKKESVVKEIKSLLSDVYCNELKRSYFLSRLRLPMLKGLSKEILIRTLIAFDRERDAELVESRIRLEKVFSVDGFYYFRLRELNDRWREIAELTEANVMLLYDESALNLLLKFLLSAVAPKYDTVRILQKAGGYLIKASYVPVVPDKLLTAGELLLSLVDIAPMEIVLENKITDCSLLMKLSDIFDVKDANNTLSFCENLQ